MNTGEVAKPAALVLAAGRSRRMGAARKQLLPWGETILLRAALTPFTQTALSRLVVVLGDEAEAVAPYLEDLPVEIVVNPTPEQGMGASLALGVSALNAGDRPFFIALGDMPLVQSATLRRLTHVFYQAKQRGVTAPVVVPTYDDRWGHPVLFDGDRRRALLQLRGDRGAKSLLRAWADAVQVCPVADVGVVSDVDTPACYRDLLQKVGL